MFASRSKWIALGLVVAAVAAPATLAESPLAAKTEAAGFTAITKYLVQHASQSDSQSASSPAFITENSASQNRFNPPAAVAASSGFRWSDAGIGASAMFGVVLILLGGALVVLRKRDRIAIASR
jgi:hypothetical protein